MDNLKVFIIVCPNHQARDHLSVAPRDFGLDSLAGFVAPGLPTNPRGTTLRLLQSWFAQQTHSGPVWHICFCRLPAFCPFLQMPKCRPSFVIILTFPALLFSRFCCCIMLEFIPGSLRHTHLTHTLKQGHASPVELIYRGPGRPVDYSYIAFNIHWFPVDHWFVAPIRGCWTRKVQHISHALSGMFEAIQCLPEKIGRAELECRPRSIRGHTTPSFGKRCSEIFATRLLSMHTSDGKMGVYGGEIGKSSPAIHLLHLQSSLWWVRRAEERLQ